MYGHGPLLCYIMFKVFTDAQFYRHAKRPVEPMQSSFRSTRQAADDAGLRSPDTAASAWLR